MKAPYTYTREDIVEINAHGGLLSLQETLALILKFKVRLAQPGEFTKRAFISGRIDLTQAEAVADLISAKTQASSRLALEQLSGKLFSEIKKISKSLMDVLIRLEANIDFSEEDIPEISKKEVIKKIKKPLNKIKKLLKSADSGIILKEGVKVAIVGLPNVGKSSILNSLLKFSRAIVTEIPGTTRDTIEELANIEGIPVRFTDTAGITKKPTDKVEKIGINRSSEAISQADLILLVLDSTSNQGIKEFLGSLDKKIKTEIGLKPVIAVLNKIDLLEQRTKEIKNRITKKMKNQKISLKIIDFIQTSAKTGQGILDLEKMIAKAVLGSEIQTDSFLVNNLRHKKSLEKAEKSLKSAIKSAKDNLTCDLIIIDIKNTLDFLGQITGENVSENILEQIFNRFCVGK